MSKTMLLDETTHDLVVINGALQLVEGLSELRQRVKVTLLAHLGEWLFDTGFGVPYRESILVKPFDEDVARAAIVNVLLGIDGVTGIVSIVLAVDAVTRELTLTVDVSTIFGPSGEIVVI